MFPEVESNGLASKLRFGWRALRYAAGHLESLRRISDVRTEFEVAEKILGKAHEKKFLNLVEKDGILTWDWEAFFRVPGLMGLRGSAVGWRMSKDIRDGKRLYYLDAFCVFHGTLCRIKIECDGEETQAVGDGLRVYGGQDGGNLEPAYSRANGDLGKGEWRLVETVVRSFLAATRNRFGD